MKALVGVAAAVLFLAGCGGDAGGPATAASSGPAKGAASVPTKADTVESLEAELVGMVREVVVALEGMKDAAATKAAVARIDALTAKVPGVIERLGKVATTVEAKKAFVEKAWGEVWATQQGAAAAIDEAAQKYPEGRQAGEAANRRFWDAMGGFLGP